MADLIQMGEFMTGGEERTAIRLRDNLPGNWKIIANKVIPFPNGVSREIDFIILGTNRIFVVDSKGLRGKIHGTDAYWILASGESRDNPLNKVEMIARSLAGRIRAEVPFIRDGLGNAPFVEAVIVFSDADVEFLIQEPRRDHILKLADSDAALKRLDRLGKDKSIAPFRDKILQRLNLLPPRETLPKLINTFRIIEPLADGPHYRAFLAQNEADAASPRRLKMYRLSGLSVEEREEQKRLIFRDYSALVRLAETRLTPGVDSPFSWADDQYMIVPQRIFNLPSLRSTYSVTVNNTPLVFRLKLAERLLSGLKTLHTNGVLHRNLTPDNIFVDASIDPPRIGFADFDFARIPGSQSIATTIDELISYTPYLAPEIKIGASFADETTDVFALGVILLELFTGQSADELRDHDGNLRCPQLTSDDPLLTPQEMDDLRDILNLMIASDSRLRSNVDDGYQLVKDLLASRQKRDVSSPASIPSVRENQNAAQTSSVLTSIGIYQPNDYVGERYKIERILGQGVTANTYLAYDDVANDLYVLKQIRHRDEADRLARNEFAALKRLHHPNIVRVVDVFSSRDPFQLKMEYVAGDSLFDLWQRHDFPWEWEKVATFGDAALSALEYLEEKGVAHRDISGRNVMVLPDGKPKIIDFGFASPVRDLNETQVGTALYRAPELEHGESWNKTCDAYAMAVLLYQMLLGEIPFEQTISGNYDKTAVHSMPTIVGGDIDTTRKAELGGVLLRALSSERSARFDSVHAFRVAFHEAIRFTTREAVEAIGERRINFWVQNIQGLYRNSRVGNADNRGLDSLFARDTYVPTRLDTELRPRLFGDNPFQDEARYAVLLLSGNPGDGKTAFLETLRHDLETRGATTLRVDKNGWQYILDGHTYAANYDASESHNGKRANELLEEILEPFQGTAFNVKNYTALLAINDGKLRDFLLNNALYPELGEQVRRLLEQTGEPTDPRIALIDLKQRSIVSGTLDKNKDDLFELTLNKLLDKSGWQDCESCRARQACPMKFNRDSLSDSENGGTVRGRLRNLLQIMHLRNERHITMRDMRSMLAFIIAGNATCEEIHDALESGRIAEEATSRLYFMAAFNPLGESDETLQYLAGSDPSRTAVPRLDQFLFFRRSHNRQEEIERVLFSLKERSTTPLQALQPVALGAEWHVALKRRVFFEGDHEALKMEAVPLPDPQSLLPYRHFNAFLQAACNETPPNILRDNICEAISRANGIVESYDTHLCVRTARNDSLDLTVFKKFPVSEFICEVGKAPTSQVESLPNTIRFSHIKSDAVLIVSLDLFEILMRFTEGYREGIEEQEPFIIDLAQFQNRLLNQRAVELLLLEGGRQMHRVRQQRGKIELLPLHESSAEATKGKR